MSKEKNTYIPFMEKLEVCILNLFLKEFSFHDTGFSNTLYIWMPLDEKYLFYFYGFMLCNFHIYVVFLAFGFISLIA